jgi:transcriptional regulator with XRE-family HTH domain
VETTAGSMAGQFGSRVRAERTRQGLTLDALASAAGVSRATLSNIERGEHNPSLNAATDVARSLGVSLSQLLGEEERRPIVRIAANERLIFQDASSGIERQLLSPPFAGHGIEWIRVTLPAGEATEDVQPYHPAIDKYVLVESGQLRVVIGREAHLVDTGDALYFRADAIHRFENAGIGECRYLAVLDYAPRR